MEFTSKELISAPFTPPNSLYVKPEKADRTLNDQLKLFISLKDKTLINKYELTFMRDCKSLSGIKRLIFILSLIKEELIKENKEDNIKNLTIRKNFDSIILTLEAMELNKLIISGDVIDTILLAFLSKNFINYEPQSTNNF